MESQLVRCGRGFCSEFFQVWRIGIGGFHDSIGTPNVGFLGEEPLLCGANIAWNTSLREGLMQTMPTGLGLVA